MASEEELADLQRLSESYVDDVPVRRVRAEGLSLCLMIYRDLWLGRGSRAKP